MYNKICIYLVFIYFLLQRPRLLQLSPAIKNKIKYQINSCTTQSDVEAEKEKELARIAKDVGNSFIIII